MNNDSSSAFSKFYGVGFSLFDYLPPRRKKQFFLFLCLALIGAIAELVTIGSVLPFLSLLADPSLFMKYPFFRDIFHSFNITDPRDLFLPSTLLFGFVALVSASIRMIISWTSVRFVFAIGHDIGVEVYRRILHQSYEYHIAQNTSETIGGINKVQIAINSVLLPMVQVIVSLILAVGLLVALMIVDFKTAFFAGFGFAAIYLTITIFMRKRLKGNSQVIALAQAKRIQALQEGVGGIRDVIIDGAQPAYLKRFEAVDGSVRVAQATNKFIGESPRYLIEAVGMILIAIVAYLLSHKEGGLAAVIPTLGALAIGAQKLLPLFQTIYAGWSNVNGNHAVIVDVVRLLKLPIPDENKKTDQAPISFTQGIELNNIFFRYHSDGPLILDDLNLKIPKGRRIGFVGKTGSGKSTTIDLLMGLLVPSQGTFKVDGQVIARTELRSWQKHIAHVPQAIFLTDATIAENIAFGHELKDIDIERVKLAARQAQIAEFIEGLSEQYHTSVGERGVRLSGGQRQRIGIARALYKQSSVLVLDEATSALDNNTEEAVMNGIKDLEQKPTVIVIAHRLSTLKFCDQIIELDAGKIVGTGTYEEIILKNK